MLCTIADVQHRLNGIDLSADQATIDALIAAAQGHIEREAGGRPLEEDSHTETFDGGRFLLLLTNWPVASVESVTEDGTALAADEFTVYDDGRLYRLQGGRRALWRTDKVQAIEVTYTGGYAPVPQDLVDLCATVVARAYRAGSEEADRPDSAAGGVRRWRLEDREEEYEPRSPEAQAAFDRGTQLTPEETDWVQRTYARPVVV